jgi:DNA end-binding protein Ku
VLWTLRYGDEVRDTDVYFGKITDEQPDSKLMTLLRQMIDARTKPWNPKMIDDPVQDRLLEIIASKQKGKKPAKVAKPRSEAPTNVVNIMDALRKSIASDGKPKGR